MDANLREELYKFHMENDSLFRRLAIETENEPDDGKFQIGYALMQLVMQGKIAISQDSFGELLFSNNLPN